MISFVTTEPTNRISIDCVIYLSGFLLRCHLIQHSKREIIYVFINNKNIFRAFVRNVFSFGRVCSDDGKSNRKKSRSLACQHTQIAFINN